MLKSPFLSYFFLSFFFLSSNPNWVKAQVEPATQSPEALQSTILLEDISASEKAEAMAELMNIFESQENYSALADLSLEYYRLPLEKDDALILKKSKLKQSIQYEEYLEDSNTLGSLHLKLAGAHFGLDEMDSAISSYSAALDRFSQNDTLFRADTYFFRAQAKDATSDMIASMQDYQKALDLYESAGDEDYAGYARGGMAVLFSRYAIYKEAEEIRKVLRQQALANEDLESLGIQYFNRGIDLGKEGNYQGQIDQYLLADSLFRETNVRPYIQAQLNFALSRVLGKTEDLSKQKEYFDKGLELMEQIPELTEESSIYLLSKGNLSLSTGDYRSAERESLALIQKEELNGDFDNYLLGLEILAEAQNKLNKKGAALATYEKYQDYKDSLFVANQATSFAYYQTLYETEKKEVEILQKEAEVKSLTAQNRQTRNRFILVIFFILLITAFGFLLVNLRQAKRKKSLQEKFTQDLLKTQEEERKRISKDLHDGLGQSLLLIKNKVALNAENQTGELLDTAINELRAIARSLHPMQLEKLGLSKAIEQMLTQLDEETDLFISSEIEDLKGKLTKDHELQLYRIAQEVLNNVLKHSQADGLRFQLNSTYEKVQMVIEDNGKGFDFSERFNDFQSLGLKTLKERIAAVGGQMKVTSEKGKGSKFEFLINH